MYACLLPYHNWWCFRWKTFPSASVHMLCSSSFLRSLRFKFRCFQTVRSTENCLHFFDDIDLFRPLYLSRLRVHCSRVVGWTRSNYREHRGVWALSAASASAQCDVQPSVRWCCAFHTDSRDITDARVKSFLLASSVLALHQATSSFDASLRVLSTMQSLKPLSDRYHFFRNFQCCFYFQVDFLEMCAVPLTLFANRHYFSVAVFSHVG